MQLGAGSSGLLIEGFDKARCCCSVLDVSDYAASMAEQHHEIG
jgi:hypothetical protein